MDRLTRARDNGVHLLGYIYPHAPVELVLAYGVVPSLVWVSPVSSGSYEHSLQTFACSYSRNLFGQRSEERLGPYSSFLFPSNTCDSLQNLADIWRHRFPQDRVLRLSYPATDYGPDSIAYMASELRELSSMLRDLTGRDFSEAQFRTSCQHVGEMRFMLQRLYILRAMYPDTISYGRLAELVRLFLTLPDEECLSTIRDAHTRISESVGGSVDRDMEGVRRSLLEKHFTSLVPTRADDSLRVAIVGGMVEPVSIADLFESATGGRLSPVFDFLSFGYKSVFVPPVPPSGDPHQEMARSLMASPKEPTTQGLESRMSDLQAMVRGLHIDGLVVCEQQFCDPDGFEAPSVERAAKSMSIPCLRLPIDPELSDRSRLVGRIQAFLETLGGGRHLV
ncbi:MAG: 2-hydroxyacyl-CoA dehydratase family protein [Candidatus Thorarchaeota archaeon]